MEQGPIPETHMHRGRENRMDKSLLSRSALVNLSLWGMFLAPTGTSLCGKLHCQHRDTET